jgi:hypothetical protein
VGGVVVSEIEFRVSWRRQEHGRVTRIYQTEQAARRKAEGILALERVKAKTTFSGMADLAEVPLIESRPVGVWSPVAEQPGEPSEGACARMKSWAGPLGPYDDDSGIF